MKHNGIKRHGLMFGIRAVMMVFIAMPPALANEASSIRACIEAVTIHSTLLLDEFDVEYEKRLMR